MKIRYAFFVILLFTFIQPLEGKAFKLQDHPEVMTHYMERSMEEYKIPGASLAIIQDGEFVYHHQYGEGTNGEAIHAETPFVIGSLSKSLTALAVMMLVENEEIDLDESINTYIPTFQYETKSGQLIKVKHLLDHTSGISSYDSYTVTDQQRSEQGAIREAVVDLSGVTLDQEPGEHYDYHSANYLLLGFIIEEVSGESFSDFMTQHLFQPLRMENTSAAYESAVEDGYMPGFQSWGGFPVASDGFYDHAGAPYGYITSTAEDLASFLYFLLEGGDLLTDENLQRMITPPEAGKTYHFGWHFSEQDQVPYHGGAVPDFRSQMYFVPDKGDAAVLLTNKYHSLEDSQITQFMDGVSLIMEGNEPGEIVPQGNLLFWSIVGGVLLFAGMSITHFILIKKRFVGRKTTIIISIICLLVSITSIPVIIQFVGLPWRTFALFAPDVAVFVYVLITIFVLHAFKSLVYLRKHIC
ncbi:serine hydrolase [Geomicrobium sp. JCM 19039]|uniref:serine hydrolase domain-containing protein n=1 Tax=Geomicrobium sp. JCM 19039 TaxID=1460636 RepID=UPI00045F3416|nr:serine hydrolase domain-containing protein [Geomicrobium sp. JCM 19039]GAK12390.1 beta-lactamase [Geomicrobium sp. JCM 19039]